MLGFIVDRKKRCDWNKRANLNDKHGLTCEFILCLFYLNLLKQIKKKFDRRKGNEIIDRMLNHFFFDILFFKI